jgi:peptide chain release factor 1
MMDRLAAIEQRYEEIDRLLADPEVSSDYSRIQKLAKEQASLRRLVVLVRGHRDVSRELEEVGAMVRDEPDQEMASLAREEKTQLEQRMERIEAELRLALIPPDPNDEKNVIMEIRAGTGGDEAGLFAADLFRMYSRYAQRMGWKTEVVDANESGLGVIKEIVFEVKGRGAFSRLKQESGVHRVQRVPLTEASGRIHTSAATVAVLPEAEEVDVDIRPDDIQIEIFNASGHGGQNVQKVATAIRITHLATGIVAVCQDERSQLKNKSKAMAVLRSRLLAREISRQQEEVSEARRSQIGSGDRSERVRTYNFPQSRVTDHRIGLTTHSLEQVLEGAIDEFIDALIEREQALKLDEASR